MEDIRFIMSLICLGSMLFTAKIHYKAYCSKEATDYYEAIINYLLTIITVLAFIGAK